MFASLGAGAGLSAIWTITAIAYERCLAISSPLSSGIKYYTNSKVEIRMSLFSREK
jgi:hypothetical protein